MVSAEKGVRPLREEVLHWDLQIELYQARLQLPTNSVFFKPTTSHKFSFYDLFKLSC